MNNAAIYKESLDKKNIGTFEGLNNWHHIQLQRLIWFQRMQYQAREIFS